MLLLQALFGLINTERENSLAADEVTAVRVSRQDRTSINREYRTQPCELQAD